MANELGATNITGATNVTGATDVDGTLTVGGNVDLTKTTDVSASLIMESYRESDSNHNLVDLHAGKGGTPGGATVCGSDTSIGQIRGKAWDGSSFRDAATIEFKT